MMADPGVQAPLRKDRKATLPRVQNFYDSKRFQDVNLMSRLYPYSEPAKLSYWSVPGGEGAWVDYPFSEVITKTFTSTSVGNSFGPTWSTHWFKVELTIPSEWQGQQVNFRWNSDSEATLWSEDGKVLQGLSSAVDNQVRTDYLITASYDGSTPSLVYYVEMAGSRICGTYINDLIDPPPSDLYFTLRMAEVAVLDTMVYKLTQDLVVLSQLADQLPDDARGYSALFTANQMVNLIIAGDDQSASDLGDLYFSKGNGARAHNLAAIGNCHIDSAWLWPYSETKRKVARSFSNQLALMDRYPDFTFVASQAQQWAWCKEYYPELFERIKVRVAEGRFLPVGGTWVEMDGNIPSGESFVRQFLHGQRFFEQELGVKCKEYWLPDTFGYSPQIPGIMRHVGLSRFLTQKMSWSFVNKFPHHNFTWRGIDGSTVLAHFPPGESYSMNATVKEARYTESNLQDKGRVSTSAFLYGYGDGGGGPTPGMIERISRMRDMDGCPRMQMTTPDALFTTLEAEQHNFCQWTGELYLELHNGTYTSQAAMKRLCRQTEFRLRDAEWLLCAATAGGLGGDLLASSLTALDGAWKKLLLNQFHDVVPGSAIGIVYEDATQLYQEANAAVQQVWDDTLASLFGSGTANQDVVFNSLQWPRREVVDLAALKSAKTDSKFAKSDPKSAKSKLQPAKNDAKSVKIDPKPREIGDQPAEGSPRAASYALVTAPAFGYSAVESLTPEYPVTLETSNGSFILSNGLVRAVISSTGQLTSLTADGVQDKDVFLTAAGEQLTGNRILLFDDEPLYWDAWDVMDYHLETETCLNDAAVSTPVAVKESGSLRSSLSWGCSVGRASSLLQEISLSADSPYVTFQTSVSWAENRKLLKVGFNTGIQTSHATYDTQFGALTRPTVVNTSWDSAKYEVCGHKYADLSETDWGVAVLNDSKYGWSAVQSSLTLTLLKSAKAPDAEADMGDHSFAYAVMPHHGSILSSGVVQRAYEFNNPLRLELLPSASVPAGTSLSWARVEGEGIVLHTVKPAEDGSGDVVLRLYECRGTRSSASVALTLPVTAIVECDGLETKGDDVSFTSANGVVSFTVKASPFSIRAFRLSF